MAPAGRSLHTSCMSLIGAPETTTTAPLPATLRLGAVHLTVSDVDRAVGWYQHALGLRIHERGPTTAELGDGEEVVVVLHEDPEARPAGRHAGLYHYALLYPSREELARAAVRLAATQTPIQGASDHGTHEAIYLPDADGNGIELAWDRDRAEWPQGLGYDGGPAALDIESLLGTVTGEEPTQHVGTGLRMGHVHLHVGSIERALHFYRDALGFEEQANLGSAAFVSAGGYHHHLGINVWQGEGVDGPPPHTPGLLRWTVQLPTAAEVADLRGRIEAAGGSVEQADAGFEVRDPWGTALRVVSTAATGLHASASVVTEKPSPYLKQLSRHFAHKLEVRFDDRRSVLPFRFGHAELTAGDGELRIDAFAQTRADLDRVCSVVGSHLERFGRRDELTVGWEAASR